MKAGLYLLCRKKNSGSASAVPLPPLPAARSGSLQFEIPFNRQQLADYLNLDRSALSKELCKMRDEGLLTFEKNRFALNELPE